ncbi:hypothetical protein ACRQ5Q_11815 [Bradyrhizobium sp. PMVTL-01]|uniref:hypothetical protein n=1 Tax=Bradyrhizobium sp. PMVTL-01 TaxID=3434999 RepID=UPI003F71E043
MNQKSSFYEVLLLVSEALMANTPHYMALILRRQAAASGRVGVDTSESTNRKPDGKTSGSEWHKSDVGD